ncbi:MAG: hypothetical protein CML22_03430 [Rheinheimera sp.]|nr:hypothetical protein [Rheinheimera sp.]MBM33339.1 hypothetical protein [Rheinheimera sp.]HAW91318.1 hypothetical protein [Candidatus Azambacteria bacterium]
MLLPVWLYTNSADKTVLNLPQNCNYIAKAALICKISQNISYDVIKLQQIGFTAAFGRVSMR